jgi:hypothetical protein
LAIHANLILITDDRFLAEAEAVFGGARSAVRECDCEGPQSAPPRNQRVNTMTKGVLVINSGSTSVKFAAYRHDGADDLGVVVRGQVGGIGDQPHFIGRDRNGKPIDTYEWGEDYPLSQENALKFIFTLLNNHLRDISFAAAGHRVVLGGIRYEHPVLVDEKVPSNIEPCAMRSYCIREAWVGRVVYATLSSPIMGGMSKWNILHDNSMSGHLPQIFGPAPEIVSGLLAHEAESHYVSRAQERRCICNCVLSWQTGGANSR